jgi:hypothetical protein
MTELQQLLADETTMDALGKVEVQAGAGEGVLYVKFVGLTPQTLKSVENLAGHVDQQPGYLLVGSFAEMKERFNQLFDEMASAYAAKAASAAEATGDGKGGSL